MSCWEDHELPVLRAIAACLASSGDDEGVSVAELAAATGFVERDVNEALRVLAEARGPYVSGNFLLQPTSGQPVITALTDRARCELDKVDRGVFPRGPAA